MNATDPLLAVVAEHDRALRQPLPDGKLTLGSDPASTLCLDDPDVSQHHAQLVVSHGQVSVSDRGATRC